MQSSRTCRGVVALLFTIALASSAVFCAAQTPSGLSPETRARVDQIAHEILANTGVPSASVALVKDGRLAYMQAYGDAKLEPRTPAKPEMHYSIGSISKQFTATAILMLAEQGKLSLDDPVARFVPNLTRANEVTIRELLSHTSGYQDYWPQDYAPPFMQHDISADQILEGWARKPLDFDPGTKWQYSNTNYVIAGIIVEKASGIALFDFLRTHAFEPLGMQGIINSDQTPLGPDDPVGYMRYGVGPLRPGPPQGKGWMFAAGELAMPVSELAKWDIGIMDQKLLKPESYKEMESEVVLKNGVGTRYGLGLDVRSMSGHRELAHSGEVVGFTAENMVFPDDHAAIVVLTNQDAADAAADIAQKIAPLLFASGDSQPSEAQARQILEGLRHGKIDRSMFTADANSYFSDAALKDFEKGLKPLGEIKELTQQRKESRGGMVLRVYTAKFKKKTLAVWTYEIPDGKLEQYQVAAQD